jgi:hypothetical protein
MLPLAPGTCLLLFSSATRVIQRMIRAWYQLSSGVQGTYCAEQSTTPSDAVDVTAVAPVASVPTAVAPAADDLKRDATTKQAAKMSKVLFPALVLFPYKLLRLVLKLCGNTKQRSRRTRKRANKRFPLCQRNVCSLYAAASA